MAKKRSEIDENCKWDLSALYADDAKWEQDFKLAEELIKKLEEFNGKLTSNAKTFLDGLNTSVLLSRKIQNLFTYAHMRRDEDNANSKYTAMDDRAQSLGTLSGTVQSFIVPEILSLDEEILNKYFEEEKDLDLYKIYLDDILRQKPHILSQKEEELLAMTGDIAQGSQNIFTMFNNADIKFPTVEGNDGEKIEITQGNFTNLLENPNQDFREKVFKAYYSAYKNNENTLAAMMNTNVKTDIFYAKARKYNSAIEAALDDDNVSVSVYDNLIKAVKKNIHLMHRYVKLKKKMLNLKEIHMYDLYVPMVNEIDMKIPYEEAKKIINKGLSPLGEDYINMLNEGFNSNWVDVYENEGKTSGAYSWGTYDSNPYVLLNYQDNVDSVFTLAHEMGHSLHSYYSIKNQPYIYYNYAIFVAEVASTFNENLLSHYLLNNTKDKKEKIYYINHYMEQIRGTIYRQTMFAEFEKWTHEMVERGESLTVETLNKKYYELNKEYYGDEIIVDKEIEMEWARIPHFYTSFYVYKYATGFSAAVALSNDVIENGEESVKKYKEFLKSGCTDYPINLLKKAGVNMETSKPVEDALKVFENLLNDME